MRIRSVSVVLCLALLTSCQDDKPKGDLPPLHPAKGKVLQNGQPVNGGGVQFRTDPPATELVVSAEVQADDQERDDDERALRPLSMTYSSSSCEAFAPRSRSEPTFT